MGLMNNGSGKTKVLDFSEVKDNFRLLDEGIYNAKIMELKEQESKNGNDMYVAEIHVDDNEGGHVIVKDYISLKPEALFKLKNLILAAIPEKKEELKGKIEFDPQDVVEVPIRVQIVHNEYNGNKYNNIKSYVAADSNSGGLI